MKVLLSIKPEYVNKIFSGEKLFEFRKAKFKKDVSTVVVYASAPVKRIVGEFEVNGILEESPTDLWQKTASHAGISKDLFFKYFSGRSKGFAIKIGKKEKYPEVVNPYVGGKRFSPPQSFRYIDE